MDAWMLALILGTMVIAPALTLWGILKLGDWLVDHVPGNDDDAHR